MKGAFHRSLTSYLIDLIKQVIAITVLYVL